MESGERRSILCPQCSRLISVDEEVCPHCGLKHPGSRWKGLGLTKGFLNGDNLIKNIIIANAGMFILSLVFNPSGMGLSMSPFAFLSPDNRSLLLLGATGTIPIERFHRWWTLISASYLHGGILHILFNMMALKQIGPLIFREFGPYRLFTIYTLGGVGGYVLSCVAGIPFTLGASAAVCGLIGAALYYGKSRGGYYGQMIYKEVGGWVLGLMVFGFFFPGINNWAHGGGLVSGIVLGFLLGYEERIRESFLHKVLGSLCALVTLLVLLWAVTSSFLILLAS